MSRERSKEMYAAARQVIPGGVNSPARSWRSVGGEPLFIAKAKGPRIWDVDGNSYIDYVASWGPMILGHAPDAVIAAIKQTAERGTSYGAPTEMETTLAQLVVKAMPSIEMVRFVSSGTEAGMSALRLARAFTKRDKIIKFDGGYHGHADALLVSAGSGAAAHGIPDSAGVTASFAKDTLVSEFNDIESVEKHFKAFPDQIAAIIVEPIPANMGVVIPKSGFLEGLRKTADRYGALLIFDEVITGFRVGYGGAQALYGVKPDITCLGKIIGGGMPVGAYGGRRDVMQTVSPLGPMYQAGTLSGNPVAMAAGIATLEALAKPGVYEALEAKGFRLAWGLQKAFKKSVTINRVGSMMTVFFTTSPVTAWQSVATTDKAAYGRFFHKMLEEGVYLAPANFEAFFVSTAHTDADIDATVAAAGRVVGKGI
ncbi:MAG: glutamate-1-semialdehyde-2,1-aminomutase [SAR202 cluster bacterium]|nr:glutamate-1-semialdehyde-2,1-aminomutase [SAR202 cluster bacterium]